MFMHLLSTTQIKSKQLQSLFKMTDSIISGELIVDNLVIKGNYSLNRKVILGIVKDEGSTRTRLSFEVAMKRLGGESVLLELDNNSSISKGETLEDTIKTVSQYVDALVVRHSRKGMVEKCAEISSVPVINAGDGDGEHPTQALLDAYTIYKHCGKLDNLNIMIAGDLKCSRTVHSLLHLLSLYENNLIHLVSPEDMQLPEEYKKKDNGTKYIWYPDLNQALEHVGKSLNILYMTRLQKERYMSEDEVKEFWSKRKTPYLGDDFRNKVVGEYYTLSPSNWNQIDHDCAVLHPLPRNNEISSTFDKDPRALYFQQVKNGMYVRMALLWNLFVRGKFLPD